MWNLNCVLSVFNILFAATMEHGAGEHVQEHTEMTIKKEVEEAIPTTKYIEIEIDVNHLKQEPGFEQVVKSEPAFMVKEGILEDSSQGTDEQQDFPSTSTCAVVGSTIAEQSQLLHVKTQLEDTDLDVGPNWHQYKDSNYGTKQMDLKGNNQENTKLDSEEVLFRGDDGQLDETMEDSQKDLSSGLDVCDSCLKKFHSKSELVSHLQNMHKSKPGRCKICEKNLECQQFLASYKKQVQSGEEYKSHSYKCDKCLKVYMSKKCLNQHSARIHGTESYKCTQCDKEFKCKLYLLKHIRNTHSAEQYECDICKKMHKSRASLQSHVSSFHRYRFADTKDGHYRCDKCSKTFQCKSVYMNHCRYTHATERYKCTICYKEFKCLPYLRIHITTVHTNRQYECDICKRVLKSKRSLRAHILQFHSGSFPGSRKQ